MSLGEINPVLSPDMKEFRKQLSVACRRSNDITLHIFLGKFPGAPLQVK